MTIIALLRIRNKKAISENTEIDEWPLITLLIAAYNEEEFIEQKIQNSLQLDYSNQCLEIFVFSDGSTDRTDEILEKFISRGIVFKRIEGRLGKTACQNICATEVSGQIVVYSDTTSVNEADAIKRLAKRFINNEIGCVAGTLKTKSIQNKSSPSDEESQYLKFLQFVKALEEKASMPVGASGAIFALKREYFVDLPAEANDDLLRPLEVIKRGKVVVFEPQAIAWEEMQDTNDSIFTKKKRIAKREALSLMLSRKLFNPFKYDTFSLQLITKILPRRLLFPAYVMATLSSMHLTFWAEEKIYALFFICFMLFIATITAGWIVRDITINLSGYRNI